MKPIKVILNPYAGRWKAKANINILKETLTRLNIPFDLTVTERPGHGIEVARAAAEAGFETVVSAGGDSTMNEVVNGLAQAARVGDSNGVAGTFGIIPLGTANDLAFTLGIPLDLTAACERLAKARTRNIDLCRVNERFFANNSAIGLEPTVTVEAEKITRIKGPVRYLIAAMRAIAKRPAWYARIEWDDGSFEGSIALVSVGNGARTGGFYMTPYATVDDGALDFVFAPAMNRLALVQLLPQTYSGKHIYDPRITYEQTRRLRIEMDETPLHTDGEIINRRAKSLIYDIFPKQLRVIV